MNQSFKLGTKLAVVFALACALALSGPADAAGKKKRSRKGYDVKILRDTWGVPHVYGKTDPDVAYGLAYAHCEDDFRTIQETLLATRGLGASILGAQAAPVDFMVHLLGVWDDVNAKYKSDLSRETRALCEAYAEGVNYYAALHPDEVLTDEIFPTTGKDVVAGFVFKAPFFYGLDSDLLELFGPERKRAVSEKRAAADFDALDAVAATGDFFKKAYPIGSNTFSVGPKRSADGSTYLNVNSHQPWEGPVAWYEAHLHSEEGWNMVGSLFPGMPLIGHGHNPDIGWAMTVNRPDLVDIYVLEINPDNPDQYRFDGKWLDLEIKDIVLKVKINKESKMTMNIKRQVIRSVHGPVMRTDHGVYAIRYAGMGDIRQVEQWYRMNKATTLDQWMDAVRMQAIASLNMGYGDKEGNILYLYNARLPIRAEGYDWRKYLPGNTSDTLWTEYLPFEDLPMVKNPPSGFVQNCNSSPFQTTDGEGNPDPAAYAESFGIETGMTNRALRALEIFGADDSITAKEFNTYKYDMKYSEESFVGKTVAIVRDTPLSDDPELREAMLLIRGWDLSTDPENRAAALAVLTIQPLFDRNRPHADPERLFEELKANARVLKKVHGRVDVPWREVNRLRRGSVDLGSGGGPDILHAVYGRIDEDGAHTIGRAGDSYVLLVRWDKDGKVSSQSIHVYGSATLREDSPHYADQAPLFVKRQLKDVWLEESEIRAHLEREYRPGEELES